MAKSSKTTLNTGKLSKSRQKQIEYWNKRAENNFLAGEKDALEVAKGLAKNYKNTMKAIDDKINGFYGKYASQNGMSLENAKQLLTKSELKSFKEYLDECIEYKKNNDIPSRQYELLKLKTKVTRWDELRTQLQYELDKLTVSNQDSIEQMLYDNYEEGYYKTIYDTEQFRGYSSSFNGLDKQAISRAISTKWLGDNYSTRIWKNENTLMNVLSQEVPRGLTLGTNPKELSKQVSQKLNTNYNNTVRLVRTEYANVLNNSTITGYKASGIDKYQVLATLDMRTCDDCGTLNDKIFDIKDAQEGINFPPFHPNCRCTTIPYFEEDEIDEMSKEELDNIGFVTYDEWKDGLVTLENGKVNYKVNKNINKLERFRNMTSDELPNVGNILLKNITSEKLWKEGLNGNSEFQRLVYGLDLNNKPTVLNAAEFEKTSKGKQLIYRGVRSAYTGTSKEISAKDILDNLKYSDKTYIGNGINSDGIYFSSKLSRASQYAGDNGAIAIAYIDPTKVKAIDELKLEEMHEEFLSKNPSIGRYSIAGDLSSFAVYKGYNCITIGGATETYYNILDRSILVIKE